jgi:uncharacterized protein YmfQ (DUF2313 family)
MRNLLDFLPKYYTESDEVIAIQNGFQIESEILRTAQEDLLNQLFVETATWGLTYWEKYLGIQVDISKDIAYRRSNIIAKIRGSGTTTIDLIKTVASSYSNGEVEIMEHPSNYSFEIKFTGTRGIPPNMEDLQYAIERIKPAHLTVTYTFTYNTWGMVSDYLWSDVSNKTWSEFSIM